MKRLRQFFLKLIRPFLVWVAGKHLPFTHKLIIGHDYREAVKRVKPGDILLTRVRGEFTTAITPGFWTHAAIYTNESVVEAEGIGVVETDFLTFLVSKDFATILRPKSSDEQRFLAAAFAKTQVGKPYDYEFAFQDGVQEAFYCSELVWWAYQLAVPKNPLKSNTDYILPDDIAYESEVDVIWDSRES